MYYKIVNKDSEVYQKLHELRLKELQFEKDNITSIEEKTGLKWNNYLGHKGQQNFCRVTDYSGFEFTEPEKVNLKIWKRDRNHPAIFVPNCRTKLGREMDEFLLNGLGKSLFTKVWDILNLPHLGKFTFPYVEIALDTILIYLDDKHIPSDEDIIEITSIEFQSLISVFS